MNGQCNDVFVYHMLIIYIYIFFQLGKSNDNKGKRLSSKDGKTTAFVETHSFIAPVSMSLIILWINGFN